MANKYGKNGEAVATFLGEVGATDLAGWRAFVELASPTDEFSAALRAAYDAPLSASARAAVASASQRTVRSLGLGDSGLGRGIMRISVRVDTAAIGLAVRDRLAPEHLRVILEPFVAIGFRSIADAAAAPTEE
jgi:hypothetical protein